ncbi:MAG TPA: substrate-binding domain-containing protein [Clostridiaceae bacterium]|jgi:putative multiple sugar transport system substrate-binding protein|nr:substrate-binding domain-containing protein [Clostridiaceae bacterium]
MKKHLKRLLSIALVLVMVFALAACGSQETTPTGSPSPPQETPQISQSPQAEQPAAGKKVGVVMPTKSLQRWNEDGANVKAALEAKGYTVDLQYADNKQDVQNSQLENMITMGCDVLVIASIDGGALGGVLQQAKAANIPVIAYDRLITNTDKCDYYATFDNYGVGKMQGEFIEQALGLNKGEKGPFTMECFGGDPGDNNAYLFNQGAMDVLQKYIDSGALVVKSGQTKFPDEIAIVNWEAKDAQNRMDNLLTAYYADENIDVVLSPNDSLAQGIVASLISAGYGGANKPFPVLTGQDCDKINVGQIIRGEQSMSIFKDTRDLANQVIAMTDAILAGQQVPTNATYNNGVIDVPSFNCEIKFADKNNWKALLVDSGYYQLSDIPDAQ